MDPMIDASPMSRAPTEVIAPELRSLVQTYVSYLSGCDACAMESLRAARAANRDPLRLHLLSTWRRAPRRTYTDRECLALVWAEVMAVSGEEGVDEALRRQAEQLFSAEELAALTRIVASTRGYRRLLVERTRGSLPRRRGRARRASPCMSPESCEACAVP